MDRGKMRAAVGAAMTIGGIVRWLSLPRRSGGLGPEGEQDSS